MWSFPEGGRTHLARPDAVLTELFVTGVLAPAGFGPRIQSGRSVMDKENQQLQAGCVACPVEEECQDAVSHPLIFQVWLGSLCGYRNA